MAMVVLIPSHLAAQQTSNSVAIRGGEGRQDLSSLATQPYSSSFSFYGRNVPLPPGEWRKVAEEFIARQAAGGGVGGRNAEVALLRVHAGRVTGLVTIRVSVDISENRAGWTREPECQRNDIHFAHVESDSQRDQNCWTINHFVMTRGADSTKFVNDYFGAAAQFGGMPPTMIRITSRIADNLHFMTVRYYFLPNVAQFPPSAEAWRQNPWHRDRLDANRTAYIAALRAWAPTAHASVVGGFRGGRVASLPEPQSATQMQQSSSPAAQREAAQREAEGRGAENRTGLVQTRDELLISDIQRELIRVGLYDGSVDGVYGPRTRRGIEEFQRTRSVRVDGLATSEILTLLRAAPPAAGTLRQQQEGVPRLDEATERRRREEAQLRQAAEARAAADLTERRRQELEARAQRDEEERRRREAAANLSRQAADAARLEQERLHREREEAEEARRAAIDELRRVTALRQELEANLQAAREAQAAMRQPPTPGPPPANAGASALAEARAAPTPFSDDFGAVNSSVGCLSSEPAASRTAIFRERYEGKEFAWTGRVRAFFPSLIELDIGTGRTNLVISLVSGQEGLPVNPGQTVSVRFTMTQLGTCSVAFRGQRGVILSVDGTSLR